MTTSVRPFRNHMCSMFSQEKGEDPGGSAARWTACLVLEIPKPWEHEVRDSKGFPKGVGEILDQVPDLRLQAIHSDEKYSRDDHSRVMLFSMPDKQIDVYERQEYLIPNSNLTALLESLVLDSDTLTSFDGYRVFGDNVRDILVCTHGSRDICCASRGYPIYEILQRDFATNSMRVWQTSHTGGHRLSPNVIEMPSGRYWGRVTPEFSERIVSREGDSTGIRSHYRGWAALASPEEQVAEREAFVREGWSWLECPSSVTTESSGMFTVKSPIASYGVNVVQVDSVPTNDCLTDDVTGEELQYGVISVSKLP